MRVEWNVDKITAEVEKEAMDRLAKGAEVVAEKARSLVPTGKNRPLYKNGKPWTAREAGTLRKSIRVVRLKGDPKLDVRVYAGARQSDRLTAYYAHMIEKGTSKMKARPFLRPALNAAKGEIMAVMGYGYGK